MAILQFVARAHVLLQVNFFTAAPQAASLSPSCRLQLQGIIRWYEYAARCCNSRIYAMLAADGVVRSQLNVLL